MARIRDDSEKLIELYAEIGIPESDSEKPYIVRVYPPDYSNKEILSSVPSFTYPCSFQCDVVTHFSFVLTNECSKWTFGYCRHTPNSDRCVVILSDLPWHSTFYKVLDYCVEIDSKTPSSNGSSGRHSSTGVGTVSSNLEAFLNELMAAELPQPGLDLTLTFAQDLKLRDFKASVPDHQRLPRIPEDRNMTEYFNAVTDMNMIAIFASMLSERRIVITSERLNRLSSCVQAANALIYPMHWQHIFIPLLPGHLIDYLSAPMPFLIGVPACTLATMRQSELTDIVLLNVDTNELKTPFDDISTLPSDVLNALRKALTKNSASLGDSLCRAFLRALVSLIGGYRAALKIVPGEQITFDNDKFVQSVRGTSRQLFLEKMLQLQIFQQFIESRLEMFNSGGTCDDQFEIELNHREIPSGNAFKAQYKEWEGKMKKEGGALVRAFNSRSKVAISKSRQAVRNIKHYIATTPSGSVPGSPKLSHSHSGSVQPKSLKKSISGSAICQTSKTVTYVRNTNGTNSLANSLNSNNFQVLGSGKSKFYYNSQSDSNRNSTGNRSSTSGSSLAPSASPESSDVEDEKFVFPDFRKLKINTNNLSSARNSTNSLNSNNSNNLANLTPIPPPRDSRRENGSSRSGARANGCTMNTEKCLIEFDSPPKEQKKSLLDEILGDDSLAGFVTTNSANNNNMNPNSGFGCLNANKSMVDSMNSNLSMLSNMNNNKVVNAINNNNNNLTGLGNMNTNANGNSSIPLAGNTNNLLFFYERNNNNFNVSIPRNSSASSMNCSMNSMNSVNSSINSSINSSAIKPTFTPSRGPYAPLPGSGSLFATPNVSQTLMHNSNLNTSSSIPSPFGDNFVPTPVRSSPFLLNELNTVHQPQTTPRAPAKQLPLIGDVKLSKPFPAAASKNWQAFD